MKIETQTNSMENRINKRDIRQVNLICPIHAANQKMKLPRKKNYDHEICCVCVQSIFRIIFYQFQNERKYQMRINMVRPLLQYAAQLCWIAKDPAALSQIEWSGRRGERTKYTTFRTIKPKSRIRFDGSLHSSPSIWNLLTINKNEKNCQSTKQMPPPTYTHLFFLKQHYILNFVATNQQLNFN